MTAAVGFKASIQAEDGAQAISLLFHQQPSFVITDLQMEPIDGLELLRLLRSGRFGLRHDLPIVILTANASEQVIAQCIAFDVDAFLVKPVSREALIERIKQLQVHPKIKKSPDYYFSLYQKDQPRALTSRLTVLLPLLGMTMKSLLWMMIFRIQKTMVSLLSMWAAMQITLWK